MIHNEKVWSSQIKTMDLIHTFTLTSFKNPTKEWYINLKKKMNFQEKEHEEKITTIKF